MIRNPENNIALPPSADRQRLRSGPRWWDRTSFYILVDQSIVSAGSFVTNVLIARRSDPGTYGKFALGLAGMIFFNSVHSALIAYPLSVGISSATLPEDGKARASAALLYTLAACLCIAIVAIPWLSRFEGIALSTLSLATLFVWQAQEICRRTLIAMPDTSRTLVGDFVSYPGQAILIYAVAQQRHQLTLFAIFTCMAATSLIGGIIQLLQIRPPMLLRDTLADAKKFWDLGSWGALTAVLNMTSSQAFLAVLGIRFGAPAAAALQSLTNVVNVANPVTLGMANAVVPRVASLNAGAGIRLATKAGLAIGLRGAALVAPYLLLVISMPTMMLTLFYGRHSAYLSLGEPLRLMALAYGLYYIAALLANVFNGLSRPRVSFNGLALSSACSLAVGLPMAATLGVAGAAAGSVLVNASRLFAQAWTLRSLRLEPV